MSSSSSIRSTAGRLTLLTDGKSQQLSSTPGREDGALIAYSSTRRNGTDTDLYVMDPRDPKTDRRVAEVKGGGWAIAILLAGSRESRSCVEYISISKVEPRGCSTLALGRDDARSAITRKADCLRGSPVCAAMERSGSLLTRARNSCDSAPSISPPASSRRKRRNRAGTSKRSTSRADGALHRLCAERGRRCAPARCSIRRPVPCAPCGALPAGRSPVSRSRLGATSVFRSCRPGARRMRTR